MSDQMHAWIWGGMAVFCLLGTVYFGYKVLQSVIKDMKEEDEN